MTHLDYIAAIPCVICSALGVTQEGRTYVHHMRTGQGMSQRAPDELGIAVCWEHHQGKTGIHGDRSAWNMVKMDEPLALAATIREAYGEAPRRRKRPNPNTPPAARGRTASPAKCLPRSV